MRKIVETRSSLSNTYVCECVHMLKYALKVLSTHRKSEFSMRRLDCKTKFASMDVLIMAEFGNIGYVKPGHGWKGKQELLDCDYEMYSVYGNKKDILLSNHAQNEKSHK